MGDLSSEDLEFRSWEGNKDLIADEDYCIARELSFMCEKVI